VDRHRVGIAWQENLDALLIVIDAVPLPCASEFINHRLKIEARTDATSGRLFAAAP
jgi:hypothetical protein